MNHMHNCPCCEPTCQCCKPDVLSIAITALNNIRAHADNDKIHLSEEEREWLDKAMADGIGGNGGCDCVEALKDYYTKREIDNLLLLDSNGYITNISSNYVTKAYLEQALAGFKPNVDWNSYATIAWANSQFYNKGDIDSMLRNAGKTSVTITPKLTSSEKTTLIATIQVDGTSYNIYAPKAFEYTPGPDPIIIDPIKEKITTIWINSEEMPALPVNASYDFTINNYSGLDGWSTIKPSNTSNLWFATSSFYSDGTFTGWSGPFFYVTPEDLIQTIPVYDHYFAEVYVASSSQPTTPTGENLFNFSSHTLRRAPENWYTTINEAQSKATTGVTQIWVSRNYYSVNKDNYNETSESGWTVPVKWYDIDKVLADAENTAQDLADSALNSAKNAIDQAKVLLEGGIDGLRDQLGIDIKGIEDRIEVVEGSLDESYFTKVEAAASGIARLYEWVQADNAPADANYALTFTLDDAHGNPIDWLNTNHRGVEYFDKYAKLLPSGTVYKYVIGSLGIINQVAQRVETLDGQVVELNTGLEELKADSWKLQIVHYALENDLIQTAMMNVVKDRISLIVTNSDNNKAVFNLAIKDNVSSAEITAQDIVLNGDVLADAIKAKELNINNTTYIKGNGDVTFAANKEYVSNFNSDGTGNIAGDSIKWGVQTNGRFALQVKGIIEALGGKIGGWTIANNYLYAENESCQLAIHPEQLYARNGSNTVWALHRDGSGQLANGKIRWNQNGELYMNVAYILEGLTSQTIKVGGGTSIFNQDGSGHVANGNIYWDADGNVTLKNYDADLMNCTIIDTDSYAITNGGVYLVTSTARTVNITVNIMPTTHTHKVSRITIIDGRDNNSYQWFNGIHYHVNSNRMISSTLDLPFAGVTKDGMSYFQFFNDGLNTKNKIIVKCLSLSENNRKPHTQIRGVCGYEGMNETSNKTGMSVYHDGIIMFQYGQIELTKPAGYYIADLSGCGSAIVPSSECYNGYWNGSDESVDLTYMPNRYVYKLTNQSGTSDEVIKTEAYWYGTLFSSSNPLGIAFGLDGYADVFKISDDV